MDRTILSGINRKLENDKYTERFLCDEIYENMKMLAFFHPFSDDLKNCFTKGMFIKSNPQAFPHIMKYLFTICDPMEFKKKFCWPLFNKAAEATFRNSTLEFLNKLNNKYSLGFGELKNKIVVFPGGMEFMRVLYELTKLIMRITLKRNVSFESGSQRAITVQEANQKLQETQIFYEKTVDFCGKVERCTNDLKLKTIALTALSENVVRCGKIDSKISLDNIFITKWIEIQKNFTHKELKHDMLRITRFQHNSEMLESRISALLETKVINWDMDNFSKFMVHIQKIHPNHYEEINKIVKNHQINLDKLCLIFDLTLPMILNYVTLFKPKSTDVLRYEINGIEKLANNTNGIFQKVMIYNQKITAHIISDQDIFIENNFNSQDHTPAKNFHIKSLILATPPISYDAVQRSENAAFRGKRISIIEDMIGRQGPPIGNSKQLSTISENSLLVTPAKARSNNLNSLISPLRSANKNRLDPLLTLRTIQKKDKFRQPLGFKTKTQLKKNKDKVNETMPNIIVSKPNFSSTIINSSKEKIEDDNQSVLNSMMTSPLADITDQQLNSTGTFVGKHSLLQHFASFEKNESSVNRSPSGRIEGRFSTEFECTVIASSVIKSCDKKKVIATSQAVYRNHMDDIENRMDDANVMNRNTNKLNNVFNLIAENGESLLNVSDSVLNTVNDNEYFGND